MRMTGTRDMELSHVLELWSGPELCSVLRTQPTSSPVALSPAQGTCLSSTPPRPNGHLHHPPPHKTSAHHDLLSSVSSQPFGLSLLLSTTSTTCLETGPNRASTASPACQQESITPALSWGSLPGLPLWGHLGKAVQGGKLGPGESTLVPAAPSRSFLSQTLIHTPFPPSSPHHQSSTSRA